MLAILTLIFVVAISMLVSKIATIALTHTGMSRERARFQARSAFTGAGFTTSESEIVVKHPIRRRIIMILILLGNAGIVTVISSLIIGFVGENNPGSQFQNFFLLFLGIALLYLSARSRRLDKFLEKIINRLLERYTSLGQRNFEKLITLMEDYEVTEVIVKDNNWLAGRTLSKLELPEEGILVLGIQRENLYIGIPRGRYEVQPDDKLIVYGRTDSVKALCKRKGKRAGKREHRKSVRRHEEELEEQDEKVEEKAS